MTRRHDGLRLPRRATDVTSLIISAAGMRFSPSFVLLYRLHTATMPNYHAEAATLRFTMPDTICL